MSLVKSEYAFPEVEDIYFETVTELITKNLSHRRYALAYDTYQKMWTAYEIALDPSNGDYSTTIDLARTTKDALFGAIGAYEHHVVAKAAINILFAFVRNNSAIVEFADLYNEFCSEL